jgi:hypothetical protein
VAAFFPYLFCLKPFFYVEPYQYCYWTGRQAASATVGNRISAGFIADLRFCGCASTMKIEVAQIKAQVPDE